MKLYKYLLFCLSLLSCQPGSENKTDLSKEFVDALNANDTALAKKIAQRELDKTRVAITDSSFAALIDANLLLQSLGFNIQKIKVENPLMKIPDSLFLSRESGYKLHSSIIKVYNLVLQKAHDRKDKEYFSGITMLPAEQWININFYNKTIKELMISNLSIQKDLAIASAIINNVDSRSIREQTEKSYLENVKNITGER